MVLFGEVEKKVYGTLDRPVKRVVQTAPGSDVPNVLDT